MSKTEKLILGLTAAIILIILLMLLFDCIALVPNMHSINPSPSNYKNPAPNLPNSANQSKNSSLNQSSQPRDIQSNGNPATSGAVPSGTNGDGNPATPPGTPPGGNVPPVPPYNNATGVPPTNTTLPNLSNITGENGGVINTPPTPNIAPENNTTLNLNQTIGMDKRVCHDVLTEANCINKDDTTTYPDFPADAIESLYLQNMEDTTVNCTFEFIITPEHGTTYYVNHTETLGPYQSGSVFNQTYSRYASVGTELFGSMVKKLCEPAGN